MPEQLMTVADVAEHLRVSDSKVRKLIANDGLQYVMIPPRSVRFRREDVERWVNERLRVFMTRSEAQPARLPMTRQLAAYNADHRPGETLTAMVKRWRKESGR